MTNDCLIDTHVRLWHAFDTKILDYGASGCLRARTFDDMEWQENLLRESLW